MPRLACWGDIEEVEGEEIENEVEGFVMRFGSVCSGIEAASVAWEPLGWKSAWFSEIEPFPCAVLAHHYPGTPNLGDMTALPERILSGEIEAPEMFCGGTPCQAFSVAGLRKSLDDDRGNLSLVFCEIANAIDSVRTAQGEQPAIIFWENVPGVLSTKDNAFGCFLAGIVGEDDPLVAPGGKWTNAGYVLGPKRAVAWRVLDAQYFGVAQRRRRVFVVASARDGFDPAAVLFEFDGVRRDTAPSREAGEGVAGTLASRTGAGGFPGTDESCIGYVQPVGSGRPAVDVSTTLRSGGTQTGGDRPPGTDVDTADSLVITMANGQGGAEIGFEPVCVTGSVTHTLKAEGFDASEDGTGRGQPIVVHGTQDPCVSEHTAFALGRNNGGENAIAFNPNQGGMGLGDVATPIGASTGGGNQGCVALPFDTTQITSPLNYSKPNYGDPCHPLAAGAHVPAVAVSLRGREGGATAELGDEVGNCLRASSGGGDKAHVLAPVAVQASQSGVRFNDTVGTLDANYGSRRHNGVMQAMQVRRLTPVECERLQGFPDNWTLIPWRKKPASECPDGPRYKALGNSWAVPNVRWIGRRIDLAVELSISKSSNGGIIK